MKRQERVSSISSPFWPVFGPQFDQLPPVFKAQYFPTADSARPLRLVGWMDHIWHRPAWLWPILWLLAQADIIFPETGSAIEASMSVMPGRDRHGRPYLKWDRLFHFKVPRRFNAVMLYDPRLKRIIERMGPLGLLEVVWNMRFDPPDTINISTVRCVLRIGHRRLWLPRLLYPDVTAVERALEDSQGISIYLRVAHPMLGSIFGYSGTFHIEPPFAPTRKINHK